MAADTFLPRIRGEPPPPTGEGSANSLKVYLQNTIIPRLRQQGNGIKMTGQGKRLEGRPSVRPRGAHKGEGCRRCL